MSRAGGFDYPARREVARRWMTRAERQLRAHEWRPTPLERRIAGDLAGATRCPSQELPPHTGEVLVWRLQRLMHLAPACRLAAMAGNWTLAEDGIDEPGPDTQVTLPGLVAAVYPTAAAAETWCRQINTTYYSPSRGRDLASMDAAATARMTAAVPGIAEHVADLEKLWGGPGDVGELLHVITGAGDVEG